MAAAPGSVSVFGMATAGEFAACGFAADPSSSLQQSGIPRFIEALFAPGLKKPFFQARDLPSVNFGLTVVRFLARRAFSNTACESS
jgi:hypothetical protein